MELSKQVAQNWEQQQIPDVEWGVYGEDKALLANFSDHDLDQFIADMRNEYLSPEGFATYETALIERYVRGQRG